jgi:hypothetical protein
MPGLGGALFVGDSKLFDLPLGVVKVGFNGYDLGKTGADTEFTPDQDIKDIIYQQDGTKPADHVRTGLEYILSCTFSEISTGLLTQLMSGISTQNSSAADDTGTIDRNQYQSMRDNEAKVLKVAAVNANGVPSTDDEDTLFFYEAIPIIDGTLINWGADSQRMLPVQFRIKWHEFTAGQSSTKSGAFGYWGDPTTEDVPAAVWPDVEAPAIVTAIAVSATSLEVTFDENIAFQSAFATDEYFADVDGEFNAPTAGVIATTKLTLTFAAATFASGDIIKLTISSIALQDTAATPNTYDGVSGLLCTNSVP